MDSAIRPIVVFNAHVIIFYSFNVLIYPTGGMCIQQIIKQSSMWYNTFFIGLTMASKHQTLWEGRIKGISIKIYDIFIFTANDMETGTFSKELQTKTSQN